MKSITISTDDPELQALVDDAKLISKQTKSASTRRAYSSDFRLFERWCGQHHQVALPATNETVGLYVVYLDKTGRKPSTIRRAMTSINQAHALAGHPEPVDKLVLELKKGVNRLRGTAKLKKTALTLERLRRVINATPQDFLGVRDRALMIVGWCAALRRSELAAIRYEDLAEVPEGISLTIPRSKSDQEGAGRKVGLPYIDSEPYLCPVRALRRWTELSKTKEGQTIKSGPVWRIVGKGGRDRLIYFSRDKGISDRRVSVIVKLAAERAGYDKKEYSGHSLRSGLATTLAHAGISERGIMGITGHKSTAMLREYIQEGGLFNDHPLVNLFSRLS